jgi:proteasome activator subunit 4
VITLKVRPDVSFTLAGLTETHVVQQDRFVKLAKKSYIPSRQSPSYSKVIRQRHAAILGICALVDSYPYTVEKWMPELLTNVLAEHTYDPVSVLPCGIRNVH